MFKVFIGKKNQKFVNSELLKWFGVKK